jgi:hypothetical protein
MTSIFESPSVDSWSPIYPALKISPALLSLVKSSSFLRRDVKVRVFYESGRLQPMKFLTFDSLIPQLHEIMESNSLLLDSFTTFASSSHRISSRTTSHYWERRVIAVTDMLSLSPSSNLNTLCHFNESLQFIPHPNQSYLDISGFDITSLDLDPLMKLQCFVALISLCASQPEAVHVSISFKPILFGEIYSPEIIQSGRNEQSTGRVYDRIGLNGSNVVVGVSDTGLDDSSCYFANAPGPRLPRYFLNSSLPLSSSYDPSHRKVIQYVAYYDGVEEYPNGHGTHVCGMVSGTPPTPSPTDGMARGAKIAFLDIGEPNGELVWPPDNFFDYPRAAGAMVESLSWGTDYPEYTFYDAYFDQEIFDSITSPHIVMVAVGNSGPNASTIASPALSKNSLHIGASDGITVMDFSSRGPLFDQRFGVDLLTPGVGTTAKSSGKPYRQTCEVTTTMGTSIATPGAAGAAALVIQYFQDSRFWASHCHWSYDRCPRHPLVVTQQTNPGEGFLPSSSLVKAILIHSGQNIDQSGQRGYRYPGNEQGFGQIQLSSVLVVEGSVTPYGFDLFVNEIQLSNHSHVNLTVQILGSTSPLKVTICWMEPPNSLMAARQLLNDVDLTVTDPHGVTWFGNNFTGGDEVNTAEIVEIVNPLRGAYLVNVSLGAMGSAPSHSPSTQNVSIVITSIGRVTNIPLTDLPSSSPTVAPSPRPSVK